MDPAFIRNFSIIAHIDHGKSTLADRLLEVTGALSQREMMEQVLDTMDLERERGITIKAHAVRLLYKAKDGKYQLNLIDTPGHVDFTYEVSRSLAGVRRRAAGGRCQPGRRGADARQHLSGARSQSRDHPGHQQDRPALRRARTHSEQIEQVIGLDASEAVLASAKNGIGIDEILEAVVKKVPPPKGDPEAPLRALIFDSWFDPYRGVIILAASSTARAQGQKIRLWSTDSKNHEVDGVGFQSPKPIPCDELSPAKSASVRQHQDGLRRQDRRHHHSTPAPPPSRCPASRRSSRWSSRALPGREPRARELRDALEKLQLNDSAFNFEPENSVALGFGFRCGFLGLLHLEIVQERLEREFDIDLITTAPGVRYRVTLATAT
jgi:GTP-binding protein LepA